jgi:hypothetical protein
LKCEGRAGGRQHKAHEFEGPEAFHAADFITLATSG